MFSFKILNIIFSFLNWFGVDFFFKLRIILFFNPFNEIVSVILKILRIYYTI